MKVDWLSGALVVGFELTGFTGICIIFLFWLRNIDYGYWLEPPPQGGSNNYTQSMFVAKIRKVSQAII